MLTLEDLIVIQIIKYFAQKMKLVLTPQGPRPFGA